MSSNNKKKQSKQRVCVVGATGHLGSAVVEELCQRGHDVVAIARRPSKSSDLLPRFEEMGVKLAFVDASKPDQSYQEVLDSASVAISCLAARPQTDFADASSDFWAIDRDANIRFGRQALEAGVQHLVLVATYEGKASRHVSEFSAAKEQAVDVLREECERKGVRLTVLRPNAYFKDLTDGAFQRVLHKGQHLVIGDGQYRINPIDRSDVAAFMADCVEEERVGEFPMGGPDVFTFREIGHLAARVLGKEEELKIRRIPLWVLRLLAMIFCLLGWVSRSMRRKAAIVQWAIYVSTHDGVAPCCGKRRLIDDYRRKADEEIHHHEAERGIDKESEVKKQI